MLRYLRRLDRETRFMIYEPGERTTTAEAQREALRDVLASDNGTVLLAEEGSHPVGFLESIGGAFRRNRHVAQLVVGVWGAYAGRGIGSALLAEAEGWAREAGLRRLEQTVMTHNVAAVSLYGKAGFVIEGTRTGSMLVDGSWVDEYYMARLLD